MALHGMQTGARKGRISTSIGTDAEAPPYGFCSGFTSIGTGAETPPYGFHSGLALSCDIVRANLLAAGWAMAISVFGLLFAASVVSQPAAGVPASSGEIH